MGKAKGRGGSNLNRIMDQWIGLIKGQGANEAILVNGSELWGKKTHNQRTQTHVAIPKGGRKRGTLEAEPLGRTGPRKKGPTHFARIQIMHADEDHCRQKGEDNKKREKMVKDRVARQAQYGSDMGKRNNYGRFLADNKREKNSKAGAGTRGLTER